MAKRLTSIRHNFRCLLPKADFRFFYFDLESLLNKLVKLCSSFFSEKFLKKVNLFSNRPHNKSIAKKNTENLVKKNK